MTCARRVSAAIIVRVGIALAILAGCGPIRADDAPTDEAASSGVADLIVPGNAAWVDTGFDVTAKEPLSIVASGTIAVGRPGRKILVRRPETLVGPQGTYLYPDELATTRFPLPAAALGPAPCYCLIGRIGDGPSFFVGQRRSWRMDESYCFRKLLNNRRVMSVK